MFDWLDQISSSDWYPLLIFAVALADAVVPLVPSETAVIIGGVAAGLGTQRIGMVIAAGAFGAWLGDNLAYILGRRAGPFLQRTLFSGKRRRRLEWAEEKLQARGAMLLVTARFIPGGRTAVTLTSGITHQPRLRFAAATLVAAVLWAAYGALLGLVGGHVFASHHTVAFVVAMAAALGLNVGLEMLRKRRRPVIEDGDGPNPVTTPAG